MTPARPPRLVVGISGATGSLYAVTLLKRARALGVAGLDEQRREAQCRRGVLRLFAHAPAHVRLPLARAALRHAGTSLHALNAAARP